MADKSPIEWTDATWNPIVGCSIATAGCTHCYAMKMAARIEAMGGAPHYAGTTKKVNGNAVWTGKLALTPERILLEPLTWRRPRRIFVNSMGDLFHEDVPDEWIDRVFAVMALAPQHTFQVLTKRAKRMREYFTQYDGYGRWGFIEQQARRIATIPTALTLATLGYRNLPNVWLGVSAERQQETDERIPELLATPAAIRFVSAEPLLGPIDFERIKLPGILNPLDALRGMTWQQMTHGQYAGRRLYSGLVFGGDRGLDWIIVGGESGPDARPMHPAWARSIREQCTAAKVPFFFKQWGEWAPQIGAVNGWEIDDDPEISRFEHREWEDGRWSEPFWPMWCDWQDGNYDEEQCVSRIGKKRAGRLLDGIEHNAIPEER